MRNKIPAEAQDLKDLGYANGWPQDPPEEEGCKALGHQQKDVNLDPSCRGLDRLYYCVECGFRYHVDSSD